MLAIAFALNFQDQILDLQYLGKNGPTTAKWKANISIERYALNYTLTMNLTCGQILQIVTGLTSCVDGIDHTDQVESMQFGVDAFLGGLCRVFVFEIQKFGVLATLRTRMAFGVNGATMISQNAQDRLITWSCLS